jgi:hypothetical protein
VRPFSEASPNACAQVVLIATSTPSAVNGLGSPEPPRLVARPETCLVVSAITGMSRLPIPTSSAVT